MKHEAIHKLYPEVVSVDENIDGVFTAYDANNNIVSIDMNAVNTKADELQAEADAKPSEDELKASAKAKLIAGEPLTEAEADTLIL